MSGDVTLQALKRLTWLSNRDASDNGSVIAGQDYDDVYFTGGTISGVNVSGNGVTATGGTASQTLANRFGQIKSVLDFTGVYNNGITDSTTGVINAVASAYSNGYQLFWPQGTYLTTASIPNFHSVRHYGSGVIKRGSDLFYVEPSATQSNTIYVSTSGADANDGLSSSFAKLTIQSSFDALPNYGPFLNGTWNIVLAAGTYTNGATLRGIPSKNRIVIRGPSVGGHPNTPTAIIDGTSASTPNGLFLQDRIYAEVREIKATAFTNSSVSYGFNTDAASDVYLNNCHGTLNQYGGFNVDNGSILRVKGGNYSNNLYHGGRAHNCSVATVGYQGDAVNNRPIISNNTVAGFAAYNGSQAHTDYCDFSTNPNNILIINQSRIDIIGTTCTGAVTADVVCEMGSSYINNTGNTFSSATPFINKWSAPYSARFWDLYDATTDRRKWGDTAWSTPQNKFHYKNGASTASFLSTGTMLIESSGDTILQLASPGTTEQAGINWAKAGNSSVGTFYYTYSDNSIRIKLDSVDSYRIETGAIRATTSNTLDLGTSGVLWRTGYFSNVYANSKIGIGTTTVSDSAALEIASTTKGLRLPNMTTAQKNAIASPVSGLLVFDTTLSKACIYSGAAWETITSV